jgi:hypothetical protein
VPSGWIVGFPETYSTLILREELGKLNVVVAASATYFLPVDFSDCIKIVRPTAEQNIQVSDSAIFYFD